LSETAIKRADIAFLKAKDVRETGETEQWRKNEMERRLLLSNARLHRAKAVEARLASRATATAPSFSGTCVAATAAAEAAAGAAAGRTLSAAASPASPTMRRGRAATPLTVVDTLDQSALRRGTATESGRRRRGQIWWDHGRSSTSRPTFYLTWN